MWAGLQTKGLYPPLSLCEQDYVLRASPYNYLYVSRATNKGPLPTIFFMWAGLRTKGLCLLVSLCEQGYQGENGDLKNRRGLDVRFNHMDFPMGDMDKNESTYADSSIGEGMDITIQVYIHGSPDSTF